MKKAIFGLFIASAIFITSCEKKQINPTQAPTVSTQVETSNPGTSARTKPSYRILFISNDKKYCLCVSKGGNCLPDVVVRPRTSVDFLINTVIETVNTGTDADVMALFVNNQTELGTVIEDIDITGVIEGNLKVTTAVSRDLTTRFLIFNKTANGEIEAGYPFVYE